MSRALRTFLRHKKRLEKGEQRPLSREERLALHRLRHEAKQHDAVLANRGRGGLSPSLVLAVLRRDGYECKIHGDRGEGEHGGLTLHHKGGILESEWLSKKGHKNDLNNLVTLCSKGHDEVHEKAREEGVDSTQVKPKGDEG